MSPGNDSNLMLSISTIASAIADASISTDPSQLAAMIMALSKKSRVKNQPEPARPAFSNMEEPTSGDQVKKKTSFHCLCYFNS